MARTKGRAVAEPVEEIEDDELETVEDDDDLEELEDEAPAPKAKGKKAAKAAKAAPAKSEAPAYGVAWLAEHVNEVLDKNVSPTSLRVVLRKMAADGEIERTVGEDRARYSFSGPGDRTVKAIIKKVRDGALERNRTDNLEKARAAKAAKAAAAVEDADEDAPKPKRKKVAAAEAPAPAKKATRKRAG